MAGNRCASLVTLVTRHSSLVACVACIALHPRSQLREQPTASTVAAASDADSKGDGEVTEGRVVTHVFDELRRMDALAAEVALQEDALRWT